MLAVVVMLAVVLIAVSTLPLRLKPAAFKLPATTLPDTLNAVSVPTLVMLPCAAVVTVPAVVALDTVPVTLAPGMFVSPAPDPKKLELTFPLLMLPVALTVDDCINDIALMLLAAMLPTVFTLPATTLPCALTIPRTVKILPSVL